MISTIPDNYKEIGNSLTQLFYNLIGFLSSPYIYGLVTSYTGGEDSKWGLSVIILWSFLGFIALLFGQRYLINEKGEISKEMFLEDLLYQNNSLDEINNDDSYIGMKRKLTYNSNFSIEDIDETEIADNNNSNKSNNNIKNEIDDNIGFIKEKSQIIQNVYGGMGHV